MRSAGWLLGSVLPLAGLAEASAQIVLVPLPGPPVLVGPLVGPDLFRPRLVVPAPSNMYLADPPACVCRPIPHRLRRVTVPYNMRRPVVLVPPRDELAGVDLDVVSPPWKRPGPAAARPKREVVGAPNAAPAPRPGPAKPKPLPPPELARNPLLEGALLVREGLKALDNREYGLAAQRFRQAAIADRTSARARFLLAQTLFALGKYREAVVAIHEGMDLDPNWPQKPFRPRLDLYSGNEAAFVGQLKALQEALARSPENRFFLFLYAYQLWFDDRRAEAVQLFRRARAVTVDPTTIDRFLRAAPPGLVAVR